MKGRFRKYIILAIVLILFTSGCGSANTPTHSLTVTFDDKQCTYNGTTPVAAGKISVTMIVEKQAHDAGLVVLTFDKGKTIDDLKALPPDADQPSWSHRVGAAERHVRPGESYTFEFTTDTGPIFLVCFFGPVPELRIGEIGPIEVKK